ncbi:heme-binding protein [uncultured Desulfovibrio sp.]|uniref:Heme-binding protein n=1 Tax=Candidatus Desulfovibrio intestinavium TaxID=2838534 RepID=A0A9D2HN12_9BACT|nr:heme-binding protein [uncultured Desulfovibrio sp.]HJA79060.1 heme-binding protein [Candidatus Desulfovibrio intestinavium]
MKRILLLALGLLLLASTALAKDVQKQLPGDLTLDEARTVLDAALAKARAQGVPMNIAVVDAGGNLKAFVRQDGAFIGSIDVSTKKAITARYFNMSSADLGAAAQPGKELFGIEATNGGLVIFGGGELLIRDNVIVGAIGVSGGSVAEDTNVAKAGAAAIK